MVSAALLRLARVAGLWGLIAWLHGGGDLSPLAWNSATLVAGLGLSLLLVAADDTPWASVLTAAVLLATSPLLQGLWQSQRGESAADALAFLKTVLILGGLLLLARLEASLKEDAAPPDAGC